MKLYRKWEGPPKKFWKDHIYWFVKYKKSLNGISVPDPHIKSYTFDNIKLFDISNFDNIKSLHKRLPAKYRKLLEYITGYNITTNDNWLCGYGKKPYDEILWCHAPSGGVNTPREKWEDMILYKYLLTKDPVVSKYNGVEYKNVKINFKRGIEKIMHDVAILYSF